MVQTEKVGRWRRREDFFGPGVFFCLIVFLDAVRRYVDDDKRGKHHKKKEGGGEGTRYLPTTTCAVGARPFVEFVDFMHGFFLASSVSPPPVDRFHVDLHLACLVLHHVRGT